MRMLSIIKQFENKPNQKRLQLLLTLLRKHKLPFTTESYSFGHEGKNVIIDFGKGKNEIVITSHHDLFPGSAGANDNASTIPVLLSLALHLQKHKPRNSIKIIFFGNEEQDCVGSRAYVRRHGIKNIKSVISLELVGAGEFVALWPISPKVKDSKTFKLITDLLKKKKVQFDSAESVPAFFSDYEPFRSAGLSDSFALTMIPKNQVEEVRAFAAGLRLKSFGILRYPLYYIYMYARVFRFMWKAFTRRLKIPLLFQRYHDKEDKSIYLSEKTLQVVGRLVKNILQELDSGL